MYNIQIYTLLPEDCFNNMKLLVAMMWIQFVYPTRIYIRLSQMHFCLFVQMVRQIDDRQIGQIDRQIDRQNCKFDAFSR